VNQRIQENRTDSTHFWVYTALLIALGVLVPMIFHQFGVAGKVFLPMHFPVIVAGLLFGPFSGLLVGLFSPVLSFLLTGMPPFPTVVVMVPELVTYGAVIGWLYQKRGLNIWIALVSSMVAGRLSLALAWWAVARLLSLSVSPLAFVVGGIVTGVPGIVGQLIFIPLLIKRLPHT